MKIGVVTLVLVSSFAFADKPIHGTFDGEVTDASGRQLWKGDDTFAGESGPGRVVMRLGNPNEATITVQTGVADIGKFHCAGEDAGRVGDFQYQHKSDTAYTAAAPGASCSVVVEKYSHDYHGWIDGRSSRRSDAA